jgi:hypothetical protein
MPPNQRLLLPGPAASTLGLVAMAGGGSSPQQKHDPLVGAQEGSMPNLQSGDEQVGRPFWNRPLTRRQALFACYIFGSIGALAVIVIGEYQAEHRLPSLADAVLYVVLAVIVGPLLVLGATLESRSLRRLLFHKDPRDR